MAHEFPLPFDLIPTILDHLPSESYFGLLRVCKAFYQHVVPRVYRSITFEARPSRRHARRLALLLRSLLERPGLAACVRSFRLQGDLVVWARTRPWPCNDAPKSSSHQLWGLEGSTVLSRTQLQLASNHFYQLLDDDWHHGLQLHGRAMDALAILVLARFTDLATLELGDGFRTYSLLLPQVLQRASTLFPKLAHVVLGDKQLPRQKSTRPRWCSALLLSRSRPHPTAVPFAPRANDRVLHDATVAIPPGAPAPLRLPAPSLSPSCISFGAR